MSDKDLSERSSSIFIAVNTTKLATSQMLSSFSLLFFDSSSFRFYYFYFLDISKCEREEFFCVLLFHFTFFSFFEMSTFHAVNRFFSPLLNTHVHNNNIEEKLTVRWDINVITIDFEHSHHTICHSLIAKNCIVISTHIKNNKFHAGVHAC